MTEPSTPAVALRAAKLADLEAIVRLENVSFAEPWTRSTLRAALTDEHTQVLLAEREGAACGYAVVWNILDEGELTSLAVAPDARGQGIGATLLKAALRACRRRGARTVFLEVRVDNVAARRLYERCGFTRAGLRRGYYGDGADAVVMKISLPAVEENHERQINSGH
jgi:ribosomal-protein-alanine N-acetyltransferase